MKQETNLRKMRKLAGISQIELAALAGIEQSSVQKYDMGSLNINNVRVITALRIAHALQCDVQDILENEPGSVFPAFPKSGESLKEFELKKSKLQSIMPNLAANKPTNIPADTFLIEKLSDIYNFSQKRWEAAAQRATASIEDEEFAEEINSHINSIISSLFSISETDLPYVDAIYPYFDAAEQPKAQKYIIDRFLMQT